MVKTLHITFFGLHITQESQLYILDKPFGTKFQCVQEKEILKITEIRWKQQTKNIVFFNVNFYASCNIFFQSGLDKKTSTVINFQFWESLGIQNLEVRDGGKFFVFADAGSHYF